ncbi:MAG: protein translocase subunit SecD, partial [Caldimicrobium sp.]
MRTTLKLKILIVIILTVFAGVLLLPTFVSELPNWFSKYIHKGKLKLGLDLKGGVHLVLKPDLEKALQNQFENIFRDLNQELAKKGIIFEGEIQGYTLYLKLDKAEDGTIFKEEVLPKFKELNLISEKKEDKKSVFLLGLSEERQNFIRDNLVNQLLEVLRNRIDQFGVAEPIITKQGKDKVVIQLPGVKDPERALRIIGQTAQLEFKLVDEDTMKRIDLPSLLALISKEERIRDPNNLEEWRSQLKPYLPPDTEFYFEITKDRETGKIIKIPLLLKRDTLLTGEFVRNAQVRIDPYFNEPYVWVQFNERGAKVFEAITSAYVGKRLAIVLDDVVRSAPVIREKITGGEAQITGSFTMEEAQDLALVLRAGALPAPVKILQNITIGPSLGRDSIEKGIKAGIIGAASVIFFAILYYKGSGVIEVIA